MLYIFGLILILLGRCVRDNICDSRIYDHATSCVQSLFVHLLIIFFLVHMIVITTLK